MIIDLIIDLLSAILTPIFNLLPTGSVPFFDDPSTGVAEQGGALVSVVNGFLPMQEALTLLKVVVGIILPAVLIYRGANWLYRHIPTLWGFGPGSG